MTATNPSADPDPETCPPHGGILPLGILVACDSRSWGGLEREVVWLSAVWRAQGHRVTLYLPVGSRLEREARAHGLAVLPHAHRGFLRIRDLVRLAGWIRREQPDIIHVHDSPSLRLMSIMLWVAKSRGLLYLTRHMGLKHTRRGVLNRLFYHQIRRVYAISGYVARAIHEHLPVPRDRVRILPPGIQRRHFTIRPMSAEEAKSQLGLDPDRIVIGMLGRITRLKGHREYLLAMQALRTGHPSIQGLVAGAAGPERVEQRFFREIETLRRQLGLADTVRFTGESLDPRVHLAAMDMFVFPSHLESFGMTGIEAMTFGLPVIACAAGAIPEIIEDGKTGILIPPLDPEALAQAVSRLMAAPDLCRRLGGSAQASTERWDIQVIASQYTSDFYRDLGTRES